MRTAKTFFPFVGSTEDITLLYESGNYEVINDSPYSLQILGVGGGTTLEPGGKNLYSNAKGGNGLQITPQNQISKNSDGSIDFNAVNTLLPPLMPVISVIVNEYFPDELPSQAYPSSLARSQGFQPPNAAVATFQITGTANYFTSLGVAYAGFPPSFNVYLAGFDFTGQASAATSDIFLFLNNLSIYNGAADNVSWICHSSPDFSPFLSIRFPWPIINASNVQDIQFAANNLEAANLYNATFYFFLQ